MICEGPAHGGAFVFAGAVPPWGFSTDTTGARGSQRGCIWYHSPL